MAKKFTSDQTVRWCPGCGDYAVLNVVQKTLEECDLDPSKVVFISGIGCASRFPYYLNCYGFHTIHGRAPAVATGLALTRDDLSIWIVVGDGDGLSIGAGHLLHLLRRNINVKILLLNNAVYGLTKGQYSPTSATGQRTGTTPFGVVEQPLNPIKFALSANASFVAKTQDIDKSHLASIIKAANSHQGSAFVEIYQNCPVYNDNAFANLKMDANRSKNVIYLEANKEIAMQDDKILNWQQGKLCLSTNVTATQPIIHKPETSSNIPYALLDFEAEYGITVFGIYQSYIRDTLEHGIEQLGKNSKHKDITDVFNSLGN